MSALPPPSADAPSATLSLPDRLRQSWADNAAAWTQAVRDGSIVSRRAGTDAAIVEAAVRALPPGGTVLDVGCGEGWLTRALTALGARVHGIDASAELIEAACEEGGSYQVLSYEAAALDSSRLGGPYDLAVFNFALLSNDVVGILRAASRRLAPGGLVVIQTAHPLAAGPPYRDEWRVESFAGFGDGFAPMPWFFRTFGSWIRTLDAAGLRVAEAVEPPNPETDEPLSLVLTAERI